MRKSHSASSKIDELYKHSMNSAFAAREGVRLIELPSTDQSDAMQIQLDQLRAARSAQKEQERKERGTFLHWRDTSAKPNTMR